MSLQRETLPIIGMHCVACSASIDRELSKIPGVLRVSAQIDTHSLYVEYDDALVTLETIAQTVDNLGFEMILEEDEETSLLRQLAQQHHESRSQALRTLTSALITLFMMLWMYLPQIPKPMGDALWWLLFPALLVYFYVVGAIHLRALQQARQKVFGMDALVSLSTTASLLGILLTLLLGGEEGGHNHVHLYLDALVMIPTFVLVGKWIEGRASRSTSSALTGLLNLSPREAQMVIDGEIRALPIRLIQPGMIIQVHPGEAIPVDGIVYSENPVVINEQTITGESAPCTKMRGAPVFAGTINLSETLYVETTGVGRQTILGQIIDTVQRTLADKPPLRRRADRLAHVFVPLVLLLAVITGCVWYFLVTPGELHTAAQYAIAVLVIACPCALGLATPTALTVALGEAAKRQILISEASALETLAQVDTILFDKTGTLTSGHPVVTHVDWFIPEEEQDAARAWIVAIERQSTHPLAQAIVQYWGETTSILSEVLCEELFGMGIIGRRGERQIRLGRDSFVAEGGVSHLPSSSQEGSHVYVSEGSQLWAIITLNDQVLMGAVEAIDLLRRQNYLLAMLTGDHPSEAERIARALHIEEVHSALLPRDKAYIVTAKTEEAHARQRYVAMVGDGVNDGEALALSDISVALAGGSDLATAMAQVILKGADLRLLPQAIYLSRATVRTIRYNFLWAMIYNVVAIPIAAGVGAPLGIVITPGIAAAAMALSSITVVFNSLLLKARISRY